MDGLTNTVKFVYKTSADIVQFVSSRAELVVRGGGSGFVSYQRFISAGYADVVSAAQCALYSRTDISTFKITVSYSRHASHAD